MNMKKLNINLVQHLWLDLKQERIDQVLSLYWISLEAT
jgi:hypothetical protein